ncbi:MAG: hypothetical protein E6J75_13420 [Deltaproteobacteria bacterium]|nr:MAG: hypothetical protein E6J75_13420 [Deltaproteobacteria bacterium]
MARPREHRATHGPPRRAHRLRLLGGRPLFAARRLFAPPPGLPFPHGGRARSYHLHVPESVRPDVAHPLVLVLHGGGGNGFGMSRLSHFNRVADERGFIAVYPDGVDAFWADGRGVTDADDHGVDDVGFLMALLDALAGRHGIDPARVFVAGISNGGFMAQRLACGRSPRCSCTAPRTPSSRMREGSSRGDRGDRRCCSRRRTRSADGPNDPAPRRPSGRPTCPTRRTIPPDSSERASPARPTSSSSPSRAVGTRGRAGSSTRPFG